MEWFCNEYIDIMASSIKNQVVFEKHYDFGRNKVQNAIFNIKVKVNVTTSLTLILFEKASIVEYACQIWSLYL